MIKKIFCTLACAFALFSMLPATVNAFDPLGDACQSAPESAACKEKLSAGGNDPITGPNGILGKATRILGFVIGIASVAFIFYGGFIYITSKGDASKIATAKTTIIYAVAGLVIALMAGVIVNYFVTEVL